MKIITFDSLSSTVRNFKNALCPKTDTSVNTPVQERHNLNCLAKTHVVLSMYNGSDADDVLAANPT